ncbi:MAG: hypothetical protein ACREUU_15545, partial [Gammaproteobacteria bacterium]
ILVNDAVVTQEGLRFSGDRIEYDTELSRVKAWSTPGKQAPGSAEVGAMTGERVKIIIKKKDKAEEDAGAAPK